MAKDRNNSELVFDKGSEIGELSIKVRNAVKRTIGPLAVLLTLETGYLFLSGSPGAFAFALISIGTFIELRTWTSGAKGLPLLPVMAIQGLVIYGIPIAVDHDVIKAYPAAFVSDAGCEVLVFDIAIALAWQLGMRLFHPSPPISYALQDFNRSGIKGWTQLGFGLITVATTFQVIYSFGLIDSVVALLPNGSSSILVALVAVVSASGFFLASMTYATASSVAKLMFWLLLVANGMISGSEFLLYSVGANLITVAIGFFWSSGRMPWRYLIISMAVLSFLNTGKTTMRERYWASADQIDEPPAVTVTSLPSVYVEWIEASYNGIVENHSSSPRGMVAAPKEKNQTLLDRIDNLQNLLFVIEAIEVEHVKPLGGATYSLIPPLLIPRVIWPNKPRSHEGQVLLNVHFGRQSLESTFETYIAWGLLPEAYGNFGPIAGALLVGAFIGALFAWIENLTARKLVISMEGFLSLTLLMNLVNSFEMVASVLVTSTFQSLIVVIGASAPFVHRTVAKKKVRAEEPEVTLDSP